MIKRIWKGPITDWYCSISRRIQKRGQLIMTRVTNYRQTSNISRTLISNIIVDNSDVVGASPVGPDPTTTLLST